MTGRRDWRIEGLRFIATMGIAIFHFEWIYYGNPVWFRHFYLWVEFFFVLSGFFLAKNAGRQEAGSGLESLRYTAKQAKKLYPAYLIGFVFCFVMYVIVHEMHGARAIGELLWKAKWEIFYLHLSGIDPTAPVINGVTAYIPALLGGGLIIHYLIRNHRKATVNVIAVIAPILIYSHIIQTYGNLSQWTAYEQWYTVGMLRGLAGMLVGVLAYEMTAALKEKSENGTTVSYVMTGVCGLLICGLVFARNYISYPDEVIYPYVFVMLIGSIYFRKAGKIWEKAEKMVLYGGRISYGIFVTHYGVCYLFLKVMPGKGYTVWFAAGYLAAAVLVGAMVDWIVRRRGLSDRPLKPLRDDAPLEK